MKTANYESRVGGWWEGAINAQCGQHGPWVRRGLRFCKRSPRKHSHRVTLCCSSLASSHSSLCQGMLPIASHPPCLLWQSPAVRYFLIPASLRLIRKSWSVFLLPSIGWMQLSGSTIFCPPHLTRGGPPAGPPFCCPPEPLSRSAPALDKAPGTREHPSTPWLDSVWFLICHSHNVRSSKPRQWCFYTSQNCFQCLVK